MIEQRRQIRGLPEGSTVAVIGAGAVGLSCAVFLQELGYRIELLDPRPPGEGASLGNAGIIATNEVLPVARVGTLRQVPSMLLDPTGPLVVRWRYLMRIAPWLARFVLASRPEEVARISRVLARLCKAAMPAWKDVVRLCRIEQQVQTNGWLRLYRTEGQLHRAHLDAAAQRALDVNVMPVSPQEIRDLEPAIEGRFYGGLFFPEVGNLTCPLKVMRSLAESIVQRGGTIAHREVCHIEMAGGRPTLNDTAGNRTVHDGAVIAAGAWSRKLVQSLGLDFPLDTERGYHVMLPTPPQRLRRPVTLPQPGFSLVQMDGGVRLTTGVEFAGLDAPPDFRRVRGMIEHARRLLPALSERPISEWLGFRPSMPNSTPVIGCLPSAPNIALAFGHGHLGITLAPITGRIVADLLSGKPPALELSELSPV